METPRRHVWSLTRIVLALAVVLTAALGCDAIPINLPDPKAGQDSSAGGDSSPYNEFDGGGTPMVDGGAGTPDAPGQPWADMGSGSGDGGVPVPRLDMKLCPGDAGDGGCLPPDATTDLEAGPDEAGAGEAGAGEAGPGEAGARPADARPADCLTAH